MCAAAAALKTFTVLKNTTLKTHFYVKYAFEWQGPQRELEWKVHKLNWEQYVITLM